MSKIIYAVHQFKNVGNSSFVVTNAPANAEVEYLVVAGGGGGGTSDNSGNSEGAGGGGAGGVLTGTLSNVTSQSYSVVVGSGGNARFVSNATGFSGEGSVFGSITATGGGGGGAGGSASNRLGLAGGSGGGGGAGGASPYAGGSGISGQGFAGGNGSDQARAAGGGGAGSVGQNGSANSTGIGGNGGSGVASSITGVSVIRGGGGGGGSYTQSGLGGSGGGGNGGNRGGGSGTLTPGGPGLANTGGGGGGAGGFSNSGPGGSGIVIVRYPIGIAEVSNNAIQATGGTIEEIFDGISLYKVHRFTTVGTHTFQVTSAGSFNQNLRFTTTGNSTFNNISSSRGTLLPSAQNYTVVVGSSGRVDISYPQGSSLNSLRFEKINPIPMTATGGNSINTISVNGISYKVHQFTTTGNSSFVVSDIGNIDKGNKVEYLVVAGGGSGGGAGGGGIMGGGGGGGGYRCSVPQELTGGREASESPLTVTEGSYSVTVGAGGSTNPGVYTRGAKGSNSVFGSIVSLGGGGGGSLGGVTAESDGGSAGGPGTYTNGGVRAAAPIQGFGVSTFSNVGYAGGGGGAGAGQRGGIGSVSLGGKGGDGLSSSITGTPVTRAGGGGGGDNNTPGAGGAGGGTAGGPNQGTAQNAQANTGGGGGGGSISGNYAVGYGGQGGSGIVIVRYPIQVV